MGVLPFAVVLSTVALTSAIARIPGGTPRQQQVFEYFPDFRYPDEMVNPEFMTAECMSEGVFPHPYKCTWFYRCHDRIGRGFFHTSYFICEPGTEFDDDLDQCIPKSGTCGDEDELYCDTLLSSCRNCNGQNLCEFQECYWGGRDAGIQRICEPGQLHNGQTCVEASCPAPNSPTGECPLNKLRPTAKWTDEASGCSEYPGCRNGKNYHETLCSSYYDCPWGTTKVQRSCPEGYLFSPQWELCIQPPKVDADCVPTNSCHPSQGEGDTCQQYSGCLEGATYEITQTLCEYYSCPEVVRKRCPGADQVFNPDTRRCQKMLSTCPPRPPITDCTPGNATFWGGCFNETGCAENGQELTVQECQNFKCSSNGNELSCQNSQVFSPASRTCVNPITFVNCPCTVDRAEFWGDCVDVTGCSADNPIKQYVKQCQHYQCSVFGTEFRCDFGQVFNPDSKTCMDPLSIANCPCTVDRAEFWGDCVDVTGCTADNPTKQTVKQCQHYQCSVFGTELRCGVGQVFNPDSKTCMEPLSIANCPCTVDRAEFWGDCVDVTGCTADNPTKQTVKQCQHYQCSVFGTELRCGLGQVFNPDSKTCMEPLSIANCPCTADRAEFWGDCVDVTGCSADNPTKQTVKQCQHYQCSVFGTEFRCDFGQVFNSDSKTCMDPLSTEYCPCTADQAEFWGDCVDITGCTADNQIQRTEKQCQYFSCSNGGTEFRCEGRQVFSPEQRSCVEPLNDALCPCTIDRANYGSDCLTTTGCNPGSLIETTVEQCQFFQCNVGGPKVSCENGLVYDNVRGECVNPLGECPLDTKCTPEYAQKWTACRNFCGNDGRKVEQCYAYSCSSSLSEKHLCNDKLPVAQQTELFVPELKICTPKLPACPRSSSPPVKTGTRGVRCKPTRANWWYNCSIRNSCVANRQPQQQQKLCEKYSCEDNGPELLCIDGQMFDIEKAACVTPLKEFQC